MPEADYYSGPEYAELLLGKDFSMPSNQKATPQTRNCATGDNLRALIERFGEDAYDQLASAVLEGTELEEEPFTKEVLRELWISSSH